MMLYVHVRLDVIPKICVREVSTCIGVGTGCASNLHGGDTIEFFASVHRTRVEKISQKVLGYNIW